MVPHAYVQNTIDFDHGDTKPINKIIFERHFGNCGDEISLYNSIFVEEFENINGKGSEQYFSKFKCECENIYYDFRAYHSMSLWIKIGMVKVLQFFDFFS